MTVRSLCGALAAAVALTGATAVASADGPERVRREVAEVASVLDLQAPPSAVAEAPASVLEAPAADAAPTPAPTATSTPVTAAAPAPTWDTCRPVRVLVNDGPAPLGARTALWQALTELAAATGLTFHDAGTTDAAPTSAWLRLPDDDPTLVVAWAPRALTDVVVPGAAATGGWYAHDGRRITKGFVVVDATPGLRTVSDELLGSLLLHELGHVVGLVHADDPARVMFPTVSAASPDRYTEHDLAALAVRTTPCR